jgi:hypothetical protein
VGSVTECSELLLKSSAGATSQDPVDHGEDFNIFLHVT